MNEIVDLASRDDFDNYMRLLEQNYYKQANNAPAPYNSMPDYPPRHV